MKTLLYICALVLAFVTGSDEQKLSGNYVGQEPPGLTAKLFAPGFISGPYGELNAVFSPDMKEFYFTRWGVQRMPAAVMVTRLVDGFWTEPVSVGFPAEYRAVDLFLTDGGNRMIFCSNRPAEGTGEPKVMDHDFWIAARTATGWGEPEPFAPAAMSPHEDYYPIVTANGNLYLNSQREGRGTNNIYCSRPIAGEYGPAEKLPAPVNSDSREFDAYVSPDETTIVFSTERPGGFGGADIYISHRQADGSWSEPRNLGGGINSPAHEFGSMFSPDGRCFFFTRSSPAGEDIYWIDAAYLKNEAKK